MPYSEGARLDRTFIFQTDIDDLPRLKDLLKLAYDKQAWKHSFGDFAHTVYAPTFKSPMEVKDSYKKLVKLHEIF